MSVPSKGSHTLTGESPDGVKAICSFKMIDCVPNSKLPSSPKYLHKWFGYHSILRLWNLKKNSRSTHLRKIVSSPTVASIETPEDVYYGMKSSVVRYYLQQGK